jgi:hypothetical protein
MSPSEAGLLDSSKIVRRRRNRLLTCLAVMLFLALFGRLVCVTSRTDTGWETIAGQWRDATVGPFVGDYAPISVREPVDQAAYWLRETKRVQAEEPDSAELAMGSALLLDSPSLAFEVRYMTVSKSAAHAGLTIPEFDTNAINRAFEEFNARCRQKCLASATRATELKPSDVRWWRLRAMMLFDGKSYRIGLVQPHVTDWLRVLQQCQDHDPDNALYNYLVAWYHFERGVDTTQLDDPIIDQANFDLGMQWFLRGQRKPYCDAGGGEMHLLFVFLQRTNAPRVEYANIVDNRSMLLRVGRMARCIARVLWHQAERQEKKRDLATALTLHRQAAHLFDQLMQRRDSPSRDLVTIFLRNAASTALEQFVGKHPGIVSKEEATRICNAANDAKNDAYAVGESSRRLTTRLQPAFSPLLMAASNLADACVAIISPLLLGGAIACALARRLCKTSEQDAAALGVLRHCVAWLVACALTFAILGMAPAEIISRAVQGWCFTLFITLFPTVGMCWLLWKIMVRRRLQFTIRTLLGVTFVWALFLGLLKAAGVIPFDIGNLPILEVSVPPRMTGGWDAQLFQQSLIAAWGRWNWAVYEWKCYSGAYTGAASALLLIAVWRWIRSLRIQSPTTSCPQDRWAHHLVCLGRSALVAAAICMLTYLWLMPSIVKNTEACCQTWMTWLRSPREYEDAMSKAMAEVRAEQNQATPPSQ